jgi:hypothetical protein
MGVHKFGNKYLPSEYRTQFKFRSHFSGKKNVSYRPGNTVYIMKIQVWLKSDTNNGYHTWRPIYIYDRFHWFRFRKINVLDESFRENQNMHFIFNHFFSVNCTVCDIMHKNTVAPDKIVHALCMLNNIGCRHTFRICNSYHFSTETSITWTHFVPVFIGILPVLLYFVIFAYINISFALLCYISTIICSLCIL